MFLWIVILAFYYYILAFIFVFKAADHKKFAITRYPFESEKEKAEPNFFLSQSNFGAIKFEQWINEH